MTRFALLCGTETIDLTPGEIVLGRAADCDIVLDNELASRRHAQLSVTDEDVTITDLSSRNGVKINHVRISRSLTLRDGDRITIGTQQLAFSVRQSSSEADGTSTIAPPASGPPAAPTQSAIATVVGRRADVFDAAFSSGEPAIIDRIVGDALREQLASIRAGGATAGLVENTAYALRLASDRASSFWYDWVFEAYLAAQLVMPSHAVDELHVIARKIRMRASQAMKSYVEWLESRTQDLKPAERFALSRLKSLLNTLKHSGQGLA